MKLTETKLSEIIRDELRLISEGKKILPEKSIQQIAKLATPYKYINA